MVKTDIIEAVFVLYLNWQQIPLFTSNEHNEPYYCEAYLESRCSTSGCTKKTNLYA
jgi:hypothetical protein